MSNCCKCYLIDEFCFRKILGLGESIRFETFEPAMRYVTDKHVIEILGMECYNLLCERKEEGSLTDLDLQLIDILQHYTAFLVNFYLIVEVLKPTALGYVHLVNPGTGMPSSATINLQASINKEKADFYSKKLKLFLQENAGAYPCLPEILCKDVNKDKKLGISNITSW